MAEHLNVEIKAKSPNPEFVHETLKSLGADYKGLDHQIDTYINCDSGRLKLRAGNIENSLIFYKRSNQEGPKESEINMAKFDAELGLNIRSVLENSHGIKVVVDKKRHIYFIDNVKFHVDEVAALGPFVEIEAIDLKGNIGREKLNEQCQHYLEVLKIHEDDLIDRSYSDLILEL